MKRIRRVLNQPEPVMSPVAPIFAAALVVIAITGILAARPYVPAPEAAVPLPVYAMTTSDQRFEDSLATVSLDKRCVARQVQESYWSKVQALQGRTKGFWQSDDAAELERLKSERQQTLQTILNRP